MTGVGHGDAAGGEQEDAFADALLVSIDREGATSDEVKDLRAENRELKEVVAEVTLKNRVLKKSLTGHGEEDDT